MDFKTHYLHIILIFTDNSYPRRPRTVSGSTGPLLAEHTPHTGKEENALYLSPFKSSHPSLAPRWLQTETEQLTMPSLCAVSPWLLRAERVVKDQSGRFKTREISLFPSPPRQLNYADNYFRLSSSLPVTFMHRRGTQNVFPIQPAWFHAPGNDRRDRPITQHAGTGEPAHTAALFKSDTYCISHEKTNKDCLWLTQVNNKAAKWLFPAKACYHL